MRAAASASEQLVGFRHGDRQASVLAGLGLPAAAPGVSTAEAERLIGLDKKRDRGGLNMVLLRDFGDPIVQSVDRATVRAALETVGAT